MGEQQHRLRGSFPKPLSTGTAWCGRSCHRRLAASPRRRLPGRRPHRQRSRRRTQGHRNLRAARRAPHRAGRGCQGVSSSRLRSALIADRCGCALRRDRAAVRSASRAARALHPLAGARTPGSRFLPPAQRPRAPRLPVRVLVFQAAPVRVVPFLRAPPRDVPAGEPILVRLFCGPSWPHASFRAGRASFLRCGSTAPSVCSQ